MDFQQSVTDKLSDTIDRFYGEAPEKYDDVIAEQMAKHFKMTAQELRLGNLVNYKGEDAPIVTVGHKGVQVRANCASSGVLFGSPDLHPIAITGDRLVRSGFKRNDTYTSEVVYELDGGWFQLVRDSEGWIMGNEQSQIPIKYFHQLQNLYYAMTGKELEIN